MAAYDEYDLSAAFYDSIDAYRDRQADVCFYVEEARAARGPVLELGCGTGRVLIPAARAGIAITGLDASAAMLARCREKIAREPDEVRARVELVEADMRAFALGRVFSLVMIPFRPFQHLLTVEDQLACLGTIRDHLEPGGELLLDLFNPSLAMLVDDSKLREWGDEPAFVAPSGERVLRRFRVAGRDLLHQVQDLEMIFHLTAPDGSARTIVESFRMRHLFRYEAEHLLVRAGFVEVQVFADFAGSPFGAVYPGELVIRARRPG